MSILILGSLSHPGAAEKIFTQPRAVIIHAPEGCAPLRVRSDRNGVIQVLARDGLYRVHRTALVRDRSHRPLADMRLFDLDTHRSQFVYLSDEALLSNAWAGTLHMHHRLPAASHFALGPDLSALISNSSTAAYYRGGIRIWEMDTKAEPVRQISYDPEGNRFLILSAGRLLEFDPDSGDVRTRHTGSDFTCLTSGRVRYLGTTRGIRRLDGRTLKPLGPLQVRLPCTSIQCARRIGADVWFGTPCGAFSLSSSGRIDYYASRRWLADDEVIDIVPEAEGRVLILTRTGLSRIEFFPMTLSKKAGHYLELTRKRHVRYGLNSAYIMEKPGDLSSGTLVDQDNDGLWTAMLLAAELFRYAVTGSEDALANAIESFEAMERLESINPVPGFPSRSFERLGYQRADLERWLPVNDDLWMWKATTSSDEIVGHFFAYGLFAEIAPNPADRERAVNLITAIMDHIIENDWYLVDHDGRPTQWGRWNPDYVNRFPVQVGDRRLNSVEILSFLQTSYYFTRDETYRKRAFELMERHGYLDNVQIPITEIGRVQGIALSSEWNHSDDELAFLSYWNLYRYAFDQTLRDIYRRAIVEHWEIERPEKNPLWYFIAASAAGQLDGLDEALWTLEQMPLDMIGWTVRNSHRKDLEFLDDNFRHQSTREVLPPDERPMSKHNSNAFRLDGGDGGSREYSGDIFLLPYWMGRYLGLIPAPAEQENES